MIYYAYLLIDPRTGLPFYAGKGYKRRMYTHESETRSGNFNNKLKCRIIQEIWSDGLQILYKQFPAKSDNAARIMEKKLIQKYGRLCDKSGILTNKHIGGNGGGRIGKPVCQYDREGNFIVEFKSASEAERQTKVPLSQITSVCRGKWKIAKGFQWKWKGDVPIPHYVRKNIHNSKPVCQYTLTGNLIGNFDSAVDAARILKFPIPSGTKINLCCHFKLPSYKGFQWCFKGDIPKNIIPQKKKILQFTLDGVYISEYESISQAVKVTKIFTISACCNGKLQQAGGFVWKFKI